MIWFVQIVIEREHSKGKNPRSLMDRTKVFETFDGSSILPEGTSRRGGIGIRTGLRNQLLQVQLLSSVRKIKHLGSAPVC